MNGVSMNSIKPSLKNNIHSASIIKTNFYHYFFRVFATYPDESFIGLTEKLVPYFEQLKKFIFNNDYSSSIFILKNYIETEKESYKEDDDTFLEYMQDLYFELFLDKLTFIPSNATSYFSAYGDLKNRELDNVINIYEINNFTSYLDTEIEADHVSTEMQYMQQLNSLLKKQIEEDEDASLIITNLQAQYNFLQGHILPWFEEFAIYLREQVEHPEGNLYYAVVGIINEFIKYDKNLVEEFIESIKD